MRWTLTVEEGEIIINAYKLNGNNERVLVDSARARNGIFLLPVNQKYIFEFKDNLKAPSFIGELDSRSFYVSENNPRRYAVYIDGAVVDGSQTYSCHGNYTNDNKTAYQLWQQKADNTGYELAPQSAGESSPSITTIPASPVVNVEVSFSLVDTIFDGIKSVVWKFGQEIVEVFDNFGNAIKHIFDTIGEFTVSATLKDSTGKEVATTSTAISVKALVCPEGQIEQGGKCVDKPTGVLASIFEDDFNDGQDDLSKWQFTGKWNTKPHGSSADLETTTSHTEAQGYLELRMDTTDVGSTVRSVPFSPQSHIRVEMRHYMQQGGSDYYFPQMSLSGVEKSFGVSITWQKSAYSPDNWCVPYNKVQFSYGIEGNQGDAQWTDAAGKSYAGYCMNKNTTLVSSDYYNRWITTVLDYDVSTGVVKVDLDNDGAIDLTGQVAQEHRIPVNQFSIGTFGWWTGHLHRIDYVKVTGVAAKEVASVTPAQIITLDAESIQALGGTLNGSVSFIEGRNGGKAAKLGGVAAPASIKIPNRDTLKFDNAATFDMWVRLDSMTGMDGYGRTVSNGTYAMSLVAKSHDRNGSAFMTTSTGGIWAATYNSTWSNGGACNIYIESPNIPLGTWFRVTYVVSSTEGIKYYVNQQLQSECKNARPSFAAMNAQDLYIGKFSDYWFPLNGAIQDVAVYKAALTTEQVQALK